MRRPDTQRREGRETRPILYVCATSGAWINPWGGKSEGAAGCRARDMWITCNWQEIWICNERIHYWSVLRWVNYSFYSISHRRWGREAFLRWEIRNSTLYILLKRLYGRICYDFSHYYFFITAFHCYFFSVHFLTSTNIYAFLFAFVISSVTLYRVHFYLSTPFFIFLRHMETLIL